MHKHINMVTYGPVMQLCQDDESAARASACDCLEGAQAPATEIPAGLEHTPTGAAQPTPTSPKVRSPQQTDWRQHITTAALERCCPSFSSKQICCFNPLCC